MTNPQPRESPRAARASRPRPALSHAWQVSRRWRAGPVETLLHRPVENPRGIGGRLLEYSHAWRAAARPALCSGRRRRASQGVGQRPGGRKARRRKDFRLTGADARALGVGAAVGFPQSHSGCRELSAKPKGEPRKTAIAGSYPRSDSPAVVEEILPSAAFLPDIKPLLFRDDVGVPARLFQFFQTGPNRPSLAAVGGAFRISPGQIRRRRLRRAVP
jgi:hypothetical protein